MEDWLADVPVKPAVPPNTDAQQQTNRQSESVASSPVSQAAWRACIDNIPACKAQSVPWGAQQQVDEESPDSLLAPQLDTAAEEEI